jgi:phosphatidylglycerol:prolipoprotein diacylglycerol transferase
MIYTLCVALGILAAFAAARVLPQNTHVPKEVRDGVRVWALVGAVLGAHLFELPADLLGWAAPSPEMLAHPGVGTMILGRTVLGGLLGGWIGVEWKKHRMGFVGATGDGFAMPLALGMTMGRMGCTFTGCCQGHVLDAGSMWAFVPSIDGGPPRFPASLIEAYFHALCAVALLLMAKMKWLQGRHLALYLTLYAALRFALETQRENTLIVGPLTYYQLLAMALFALAGGTLVRRSIDALRAAS